MPKRKSINVEGFGHRNPIPAASRIGNMIVSGGIYGLDPATGKAADTLEAQCALMFAHMRRVVEAGGGTTADIIKMTVWMTDPAHRPVLNQEWIKMFPDEASRPARHTMRANLDGGMLVQCDFTAVIGEQ
jgi:2-iminobutanoate/2-iminopropanoate deaminase